MSVPNKHAPNSVSPRRLSVGTPSAATSTQSAPMATSTSTTSTPTRKPRKKSAPKARDPDNPSLVPPKPKSSTAESPPPNKKPTSKGKSSGSPKSTLTMRSVRRLQAESTSNAKHSTGFWNERCPGNSKRLWLPTGTDCVGSPGITSSGCSRSSESISKWTVTTTTTPLPPNSSLMTSCPSFTCSPADTTVFDHNEEKAKHRETRQKARQKIEYQNAKRLNRKPTAINLTTADKTIVRSRVVRVFPTHKQRRRFDDWLAAFRKTWNLCVDDVYKHPDSVIDESVLRDKFVTRKTAIIDNKKNEWVFRTPKRIREYAVKDYFASVKACETKLKKKQIKKFRMGFKVKDDPRQTISISNEALNRVKPKEPLVPPKRCKKKRAAYDQERAAYDQRKEMLCGMTAEELRPLAAEAGVKKPWKYTADDLVEFILGKGDESAHQINIHGEILRTSEQVLFSDLQSNARLTRSGAGWFLQIPYYISEDELRSKPMVDNDDIISLDPGVRKFISFYSPRGDCGVSGHDLSPWIGKMLGRIKKAHTKRKQAKLTRRLENSVEDYHWKLCHWLLRNYRTVLVPRLYVCKNTGKYLRDRQRYMNHCGFVDRLRCKVLDYPGRRVIECKEYWTSKTCGQCGVVNKKITTQEVFSCRKCGFECDRDINGARNILLRAM